MAIKDLMIHIDDSQTCKQRLQAAIQLAQTHDAHLTGLYVMRSLADIMMYPIVPIAGKARDMLQKPLREARDQARTMFETITNNAGLVAQWRDMEGGLPETLNTNARHADVVVLGQHHPDDAADHNEGLANRVLLGAGRPCLMIPFIGPQKTLGKRVLVAWNGRREAARAVHDALPILQKADNVSVLTVDPTAREGEIPCADICHHLALHGVQTEAVSHTASDIDIGNVLLSYAAGLETDMIVMGAYGHSRISEMMLGGATRAIMSQMTVPVFMSH